MSPTGLRLRFSPAFLTLAATKARQSLTLTTTLLIAISSFAQQPSPTPLPNPPDNSQSAANNNYSAISVPPGTRIALVLTQPVQTRYLHRGDDIYAQIVSPVTAGNEVVIPPGTFVQGKLDKVERHGQRGIIHLQSMSITFPDGYVAPIAGPMTLDSPDGYARIDPGNRRGLAAVAFPLTGAGIGALIGHSTASPQTDTITLPPGCSGPPPGCLTSSLPVEGATAKSTIIGAMIGGAIGAVGSIAVFVSTHNFFLDVGSPVAMTLQRPLTLEQDEVSQAIRDADQHPAPEQPIAQRPQPTPPPQNTDPGICYTPGTPGTPDIDIPGSPAIGDSPGTPPTHIPGIPATPPTPHPCS
jgi:hypothetical protein